MAAPADDARDAWRSLTELFLSGQVHDGVHAACEEVALPHPGALKALVLLDPDNAPSMRAMAGALGVDASYITGLVDALEVRGYVERRTSALDRRVKLVQLTETGRRARDHALQVMTTPPDGFAALTAAETRTLADLLRRVAASCPASLGPATPTNGAT